MTRRKVVRYSLYFKEGTQAMSSLLLTSASLPTTMAFPVAQTKGMILLIEREPAICELLCFTLLLHGYRPLAFAYKEHALALEDRSIPEYLPELILMDVSHEADVTETIAEFT